PRGRAGVGASSTRCSAASRRPGRSGCTGASTSATSGPSASTATSAWRRWRPMRWAAPSPRRSPGRCWGTSPLSTDRNGLTGLFRSRRCVAYRSVQPTPPVRASGSRCTRRAVSHGWPASRTFERWGVHSKVGTGAPERRQTGGMTERPPIRRAPPDFEVVEVVAVTERSPRLRAITLAGPGLEGFRLAGPAASLRLLLRRDGPLELPRWTGNEFRFEDGTRPPIRTVTPLRPDPERGSVDVEVVLHPGAPGPLSDWGQHAAPGEQVAVSGPGRGYPVDATDRRYLIVGD